MNPTLGTLQRIAEIEFGAIVLDSQQIGEKVRLLLVDQSYVDVWLSHSMPNRFGFHWERRHVDGAMYRYDTSQIRLGILSAHFHGTSTMVCRQRWKMLLFGMV